LVCRERKSERRAVKLYRRRDFMDPVVSPEGANGGHMTVEVKCEVHVATTNGLSLGGMLFYR
jgi:hypothetical protein